MSVLSAIVPAMGIRRANQLTAAAAALPIVDTSKMVERGVLSPWQTGQLSSIVWADLFGAENITMVSRADAMMCPAVAKGRHVIVGQGAGLPLRVLGTDGVLPDAQQPSWLYRTDGAMTPWHRMAWTLDDLIFTGWSLWRRVNGADRFPLSADRVDIDAWQFDNDGHVLIDGVIARADEVILFAGPGEGLCTAAASTIRAYRQTEASWQGRVRNPVPMTELHQINDDDMTQEEVDKYVGAWASARTNVNGAIGFTPYNLELRVHGVDAASTMVEARNALRTDVANHLGLPTAALDGSVATASLTYVTQDGKFSELAEGLRMWYEPIEQRLSQDDCVPRGQRVRFDTGDRSAVPSSGTGPEVLD